MSVPDFAKYKHFYLLTQIFLCVPQLHTCLCKIMFKLQWVLRQLLRFQQGADQSGPYTYNELLGLI